MLEEHLEYVDDRTRLEQFRQDIGRVIRPADRVADVGCGSAVLGLMCFHANAVQDVLIRANALRSPRQSQEGRVRAIVLGSCDGQWSTQEIEHAVLRGYSDLFRSQEAISRFVSHALGRDTE